MKDTHNAMYAFFLLYLITIIDELTSNVPVWATHAITAPAWRFVMTPPALRAAWPMFRPTATLFGIVSSFESD